ncbi:hypothetical protein AXF42_Ash017035 [Apostasia shenzhenica]|uniref:Uncharacterized protein n=1 Tax=Apostasia shenzhenica TaxID=1088818 RepID=A0A2I0B7L8_9ASPA|nr:hypothetical protein AXF42_Ash017035 [Apostasia shenzhenica]
MIRKTSLSDNLEPKSTPLALKLILSLGHNSTYDVLPHSGISLEKLLTLQLCMLVRRYELVYHPLMPSIFLSSSLHLLKIAKL